jgi:hypothetical protein
MTIQRRRQVHCCAASSVLKLHGLGLRSNSRSKFSAAVSDFGCHSGGSPRYAEDTRRCWPQKQLIQCSHPVTNHTGRCHRGAFDVGVLTIDSRSSFGSPSSPLTVEVHSVELSPQQLNCGARHPILDPLLPVGFASWLPTILVLTVVFQAGFSGVWVTVFCSRCRTETLYFPWLNSDHSKRHAIYGS